MGHSSDGGLTSVATGPAQLMEYRHAVCCIRGLTFWLGVLLHAGGTKEFLVRASYLEIYNEEVCSWLEATCWRRGVWEERSNTRGMAPCSC